MNPMDCKQAQNVWSRVMAAQTAAPCTNAEKAPEKTARTQQAPAVSITPEQVMQAMHEELCDAETYRCLAARMSGCARKTLLAISHDERCHAKKLGAIYFLLTGKKACPKKPENPCAPLKSEKTPTLPFHPTFSWTERQKHCFRTKISVQFSTLRKRT